MPPSPADVELAFADGDRKALETAYNMWGALIYTIALRGTGDVNAATDVTRDTFLSVWHRGFSTESGKSLKTTLEATCRALARARVRRMADSGADVPAATDEVIDRVIVRDELTAMGEPVRSVLRWAIQDGQDHTEIAERLDMPPDHVAIHVYNGLILMSRRVESSRG